MKEFANENPDLADTMKTHLIFDLDDYGIWSDDYGRFLVKRASAISEELQKRVIPRDIDEHGQLSRADDYEGEMASFE